VLLTKSVNSASRVRRYPCHVRSQGFQGQGPRRPGVPPVVSGRRPLAAFVSSGMRTSLEEAARTICFEHLAASPFTPWLFEYTPAAAEHAADAYLEAVGAADLIIWLAGASTSHAVQAELQRGFDLGKPFLVLRLPVSERDQATTDWSSRLRKSFKTKDVADLASLGDELDAAVSDFVIGAVRSFEPRRGGELVALEKHLRALAASRWMAVGLSTEKALQLSADLSIGSSPREVFPTAAEPLRVIEAPVGAGKTLTAVRYLQRAVLAAADDPTAPLPVWIAVGDSRSIDVVIAGAIERSGRSPGSPVVAVVDGLDELPGAAAAEALQAARVLAAAGNNNRVIVTSRPIGLQLRAAEIATMPELSMVESASLMKQSFDVDISDYTLHNLPDSIKSALARPLFALILGRRLSVGGRNPLAVGDLIAGLVTDAIGRALADELTANRELEWFGGVAIDLGLVDIRDIANASDRLERWRYATMMALSTLSRDRVDELMTVVTMANPGFAGEAIGASSWGDDSLVNSDADLGARFHAAMRAWTGGLGTIGTFIGPRVNGEVATLGISANETGVRYGWSRTRNDPKVMTLPPDAMQPARPTEWTRRHYRGGASVDPLWVWRTTREDLRGELERLLASRGVFPDSPDLRAEAAWLAALELSGIGEHFYGPLDAAQVRDRLTALGSDELISTRHGLLLLAPLRDKLASQVVELSNPYGCPDIERDSWIWSGFSDEALLHRTRAVYEASVRIYQAFVEQFFQSFRPSLYLHQLLPARLVGRLRPWKGGQGLTGAPGLTYVIYPLAPESSTQIAIELEGPEETERESRDWGWSALREVATDIRRLRPSAPQWLTPSSHSTVLDVFGADPAWRLAEGWLHDDLRRLGWADQFSRPRRM
jgi:hypothetical protein